MVYNKDEIKCCPSPVDEAIVKHSPELVITTVKNISSRGVQALNLAQRLEFFLFANGEQNAEANAREPHCIRDELELHEEVLMRIEDALQRIVNQMGV